MTRWLLTAGCGLGLCAAGALAVMSWHRSQPRPVAPAPIEHAAGAERGPNDPVDRLNRAITRGQVRLDFSAARGYLEPVLKALDVPVESQALVYSQTSRQRDAIGPTTPRAIYFNDRTAVAWVPGGELELMTYGAGEGVAFYTLAQKAGARPAFKPGERCFECHTLPESGRLQGWLMRSVHPDRRLDLFAVDDRTPFPDRWGGWYVTGRQVPAGHLGTDLSRQPLSVRYPTAHSDIVALLILAHQAGMTNLIARVDHEARLLEQDGAASTSVGDIGRLRTLADRLVDGLLFAGEATWRGPIRGSSGFAEAFSALGPRDPSGRSLRDLDLDRRLFRYPCSYMIYSAAFDGLPPAAKQLVYRGLRAALSDAPQGLSTISPENRRAIRDILGATVRDWNETPGTASNAPSSTGDPLRR